MGDISISYRRCAIEALIVSEADLGMCFGEGGVIQDGRLKWTNEEREWVAGSSVRWGIG